MRIAVIGGGINGIMSGWQLASAGHSVDLFERGTIMSETSSASSKLLHGGLRYLERGHFGLVREALKERAWWLAAAPQLTSVVTLFLPVYSGSSRSRATLAVGLTLYDLLAGQDGLPRHRWWPARHIPVDAGDLPTEGLKGAFEFHDGMMDDHALGLWAADQARAAGLPIFEHTPVIRIDTDGTATLASAPRRFDTIINAAGPWAADLLAKSGIHSKYRIDLVRGSHLIIDRHRRAGVVAQHPLDGRIVFVLPYNGRTLVGTTERRQSLSERPTCTDEEKTYLLTAFNGVSQDPATDADILSTFSGIRPLVDAGRPMAYQPRESVIERTGRVVSIFGGKWTSSHALAARVAANV